MIFHIGIRNIEIMITFLNLSRSKSVKNLPELIERIYSKQSILDRLINKLGVASVIETDLSNDAIQFSFTIYWVLVSFIEG